jgi:hypothetical protein
MASCPTGITAPDFSLALGSFKDGQIDDPGGRPSGPFLESTIAPASPPGQMRPLSRAYVEVHSPNPAEARGIIARGWYRSGRRRAACAPDSAQRRPYQLPPEAPT